MPANACLCADQRTLTFDPGAFVAASVSLSRGLRQLGSVGGDPRFALGVGGMMQGAQMKSQPSRPVLLCESECLGLLRSERIGRVAMTVNALPAVLAVNYRVIDGTVMFYTGLGKRLLA